MGADAEQRPTDRLRILAVDGGGIRGLIPALVIADLERRLRERAGDGARVSDYFHLFAGTSTGGLIALALTAPDADHPDRPQVSADQLAFLYVEDGPKIFDRSLWQRIRTVDGFAGPKYRPEPLRDAVTRRLGSGALADALREVIVTSYDMTAREPFFFKRWRARERLDPSGPLMEERNNPIVDVALATAAAPTYFPAHELGARALIDGGVFAANPVVAAITEALKRTESPGRLSIDDLLVVSVGTGLHEQGYDAADVRGWGKLGWILPKEDDPPILGAVLDGASDAADHWAHMLLNHVAGRDAPSSRETGRGPRYYRLQVKLEDSIPLDDAGEDALTNELPAAAAELIAERDEEIDEIVTRLLRAGPLPPDPA